jgi:Pyruvate/2-oxoacid:ferredoxin oxidoreductase gamma subunit
VHAALNWAFAAVTNLLDPEAIRLAIAESVPGHMRDVNIRAFEAGFNYSLSAHNGAETMDASQVVE